MRALCAAVQNKLPWLLPAHQRHDARRNLFDCIAILAPCMHKVFPRRSRLLTPFGLRGDEALHGERLTTLRHWRRQSRRSYTDKNPGLAISYGLSLAFIFGVRRSLNLRPERSWFDQTRTRADSAAGRPSADREKFLSLDWGMKWASEAGTERVRDERRMRWMIPVSVKTSTDCFSSTCRINPRVSAW